MEEKLVVSVDASDSDSPEETLFKCAMALSKRYSICIVCLIDSLHAGTRQMVEDKFIHHGVAPDDIGKVKPTFQ